MIVAPSITTQMLIRGSYAPCLRRLQSFRADRTSRAGAASATTSASLYTRFASTCSRLTDAFPVVVLAGAGIALMCPHSLSWFKGALFERSFQLSMMVMGLTLSLPQLRIAMTNPRVALIGLVAQYAIMPLMGLLTSSSMSNTSFKTGTILVSCCPGGAASNLVSLLAGADTALSVVMTTASTLVASIVTPILFKLLAGTVVEVSATSLILSTSKLVLAPLAFGVGARVLAPQACDLAKPFCSLIAVLMVSLVCASVIAKHSVEIVTTGFTLPLLVSLMHCGGFAVGFGVARLLGFDARSQRTVSIEVGMQNSALACLLAYASPAIPDAAALPCAISASVHSTLGSTLAGIWRNTDRGAGST